MNGHSSAISILLLAFFPFKGKNCLPHTTEVYNADSYGYGQEMGEQQSHGT